MRSAWIRSVPGAIATGLVISMRYCSWFWTRMANPPAIAGGTDRFQHKTQKRKFMCYGGCYASKKKRADLCRNTKPTLYHQPSQERMTIMTTHVSAPALEETPHVSDALRRHAQSVINNRSIDPNGETLSVTLWRSMIRGSLTSCVAQMRVNRSSIPPTSRQHPKPTKTIQSKQRSKCWQK